jgi:rhodanese-related sulfurtransferase
MTTVKKITTEEAQALMDADVVYVDVRTPEEFADGHVPSAVNVPYLVTDPTGQRVPNLNFVQVFEASFEKDQPLIVGCKSGGRSAKACAELAAAGFSKLHDMTVGFDGGKDPFGKVFAGWQQEGREVEFDAEDDRTYTGIQRVVTRQASD